MKQRELPPLRRAHHLQLLQGGGQLFATMVRTIDQSVREVRLETYIFQADATGLQVAGALMRAARRGVDVTLVMDGVGASELPSALTQQFDEAGVKWRLFRPLGRLGLLIPSNWRRLHRKLCVVDGRVAFCGGVNVLDDWDDPNHGPLSAPRLDFAVRVTGPLVKDVHAVMTQFWWRLQAGKLARDAHLPTAWRQLEEAVNKAQLIEATDEGAGEPAPARGSSYAALVLRDNLRHRTRIERAYRKAIAEAHEEIIIANAYFAPGHKLRRALLHAVRRGVRVRVLLQGRYEYFMQFHAARVVYGMLLGAGVEIYEYAPSFLHAKVAVIDGRWATVGSCNLEPLSLLLAREANVVMVDAAFAGDLRNRLMHAMEHESRRVDPADYARRPWRQRLLDRAAFGLMRLGVFLTGNRY